VGSALRKDRTTNRNSS